MGLGHRQPPLSHMSAKSCPVIAAFARGDRDGACYGRSSNPQSNSICGWDVYSRGRDGCGRFCLWYRCRRVWLHFLPPAQTTALIVAYGLIVQGISVWKLRRSIRLVRLIPFLLGGAIGGPIGVELLGWTSPAPLRLSVGIVLILFSLYSLVRPQITPVTTGKATDGAIGVLNGIVGGATGLA